MTVVLKLYVDHKMIADREVKFLNSSGKHFYRDAFVDLRVRQIAEETRQLLAEHSQRHFLYGKEWIIVAVYQSRIRPADISDKEMEQFENLIASKKTKAA